MPSQAREPSLGPGLAPSPGVYKNPHREPMVGDLILVRLEVQKPGDAPFEIALVLKVNLDTTMLVQWLGNRASNLPGPYRKGWMESSGKAGRLKRQRYHYFADKPESHQEDQTQLQYTNLICGTVVTPETVPW